MTEVWEEKLKSGSMNIEDGRKPNKNSSEKDTQNDSDSKKVNQEVKICSVCGKTFKNNRQFKIHKRQCKEKDQGGKERKKDKKGAEDKKIQKELPDIHQKLMNEMEAIKEERKKLEMERASFKEEVKRELEKLREEKVSIGKGGELEQNEMDFEIAQKELKEGRESKGFDGTIVIDADEEMNEGKELQEIEGELDKIGPEIAEIGKGITELELEELSSDLEEIETELSTKVDFAALTRMSEDYKQSVDQVEEKVNSLNKKLDNVIRDMEDAASKYGTYQNVVREIDKLDDKTTEILEEIGFGESLNVAKIPPNILESVYESTIEGAVNEIHRNYGSHDAENIITKALEDVRTRTSGSELFYFNGRNLKTRNLAKAISSKLISAKQVQTTYDELLRRLLDYLPGYKPKNFRAMIKLKSQEYAVDKTTLLLESIEIIKEHIDNLKNMVGSVSNRQNTIEIEINRISGTKANKDDLEKLNMAIEEIKAKQNNLDEALKSLIEEQKAEKKSLSDALVNVHAKLKEIDEKLPQVKKKTSPKHEEKEEKEEKKKKEGEGLDIIEEIVADYEANLSEDEIRIVKLIPSNGYTQTKIKKELVDVIDENKLEECIKSLIDKGIMSTKKRGRHTIYFVGIQSKGGEK